MRQTKSTKNDQRSAIFTQGTVGKALLTFAAFMFFGNVLQQLYSITDSIIVGNILGPAALAAIGASVPINRLSIAVAIGGTIGISVVISQLVGANDADNTKKTISTSYLFFAALSLLIMIPGWVFAKDLLRLFHTPQELLDDAAGYLRITFLFIFPMLGYNVISAIFRGFGNSKVPLFMLLISTVLNIPLDFVALLVLKTGINGTAWATAVSQCISFCLAAKLFNRQYTAYRVSWKGLRFDASLLKRCLKIGIPSGIKGAAYWGGMTLIMSSVNLYGTAAVAGFSIASRIDSFLQTPLISIQSSLAAFVGQNVGAGKINRIKTGIRISMLMGVVFALAMSVLVYFAAPSIMSLFVQDGTVIAIGARYLRIVSLFYVAYALQEVLQGLPVGCGDTWILLLSTVVAMWGVRLPLVWLLTKTFGMDGIWYAMPAGWFIAILFTQGYYFSKKWERHIL